MRKRTIGLVIFAAAFAGSAIGQAAHLSGVQSTVGASVPTSGSFLGGGLAVDGNGNVYMVDFGGNRVLKETLSAGVYTETTIGSGLNSPFGVAVDASGKVFIADYGNSRVLMETPSGSGYTQTTVQTSSQILPTDVAVDSDGNLYITNINEYGGNVLKETLLSGSYTESVLPTTTLKDPQGVAVDLNGVVYIADTSNNRVLMETPSTTGYSESTIGSGLSSPYGVGLDGSGNVYIADFANHRVLKETLSSGSYTQTVVAGTVAIGEGDPRNVAVDGSGNVYVGGIVYGALKLWAATPNFGAASINVPTRFNFTFAFTFDTGGTVGAPVVMTQGATNLDFTDAGTGTCTANGASHTYSPGDQCTVAVAFNPTRPGTRYGAVELQDNSGNVIATGYVQGTGVGPQVNFPVGAQSAIGGGQVSQWGVAVDGAGNVYTVDQGANTVYKETPSQSGYTQSTVVSGLNAPTGIAVDGAGNVYICNSNADTVVKETPLSSGGYVQSTVDANLINPVAVAVDGGGNVYIADFDNTRVVEDTLSPGGYVQSTLLSPPIGVTGLAVDGSGSVYLAYYGVATLSKETPSSSGGYIGSTFGSGLAYPVSIAVDGVGNVYVADSGASTVYKETLSSGSYTQSIVANTSAENMDTFGVAVDGSGNVFIADSGSSTVTTIKLDFADPPSLYFVSTAYGSTSTDSPQTLALENAGNAALTFSVPSAGSNPSIAPSFTWNSSGASACPLVDSVSSTPGTLAAGSTCQLPISFTPASVGSISGSLFLTDNNLNTSTTQTIALSGTSYYATPTVSVVSSASPIFLSGAVTFTATVSSTAGIPTGTVYFFDGAANLGSAPVSAPTYTTSGLAAGTHSITAVYSGDANFLSGTSSSFTETVVDFTVALSTASGVSGSLTASPGGMAAYPFVITPVGGSVLPGDVSLSIAGIPTGATVVFAPATVSAGSGTTNVTLLVTLPAQSAAAHPAGRPFGEGPLPVALGLLLLPFIGRLRKGARSGNRIVCLLLLGLAGAVMAVGVTGCGGSSKPSPQNYTMTVTGSAGSLSHSTTVNLTVE